MNKLIQLINIDTQEIYFEEIIDSKNNIRINMLQGHIDHEFIIKNIKLEYREYNLDENGNVIIPVIPNEPTE